MTENQYKNKKSIYNVRHDSMRDDDNAFFRYKAIFENTGNAVVVYTVEGDGEDFIFADFNPAAEQIEGIKREDVVGKRVTDVFPGVKDFGLFDVFRRVWKTGVSENHPILQYKDQRMSGWRKNFVSKISDDDIVAIYSDETEFKLMEERLRELYKHSDKMDKLYKSLLTAMHNAVVIYDISGKISYANPAFTKLFGFLLSDDDPMLPESFIPASEKERSDVIRRRVLIAGETISEFEVKRLTKEGRPLDVSLSAACYYDDDGNIAGYFEIYRDVTEVRRMERQLRQAQKMEAIGTLAGGIAHDFNNILFPIMGYAEMAREETGVSASLRDYLEEILKASHRAKDLVNQILSFSRETSHETRPIRIQPIVKEALKLLRASLPSTIEIRQEIDKECGAVMGDPTGIHQIVMNLCSNAYHAMREKGGIMEVRLTHFDVNEFLGAMHLSPGRYIRLTISDTGHGMDSFVKEKIFEPYFTTKKVGEGTGMGLFVVHGIVKGLGGDIRVYSEPNVGTTFHIYIPCIEQERLPDTDKAVAHIVEQGGNEHILLIDDELPIIKMIQQMLERLGYRVTPRTSSVEALELFRVRPDAFDLIITDMTMPNMTGTDLSEQILKVRPDIPIVLCTGFSEFITEKKARAMGIREFVMKPVVKSKLSAVLRRLLEK
jgi:PAS domain S-box-containing protein